MTRPIEEQIAEVGREIGLRKHVYRGFVARGKMKQEEADHRIACMEAAYATLKWVKKHRDAILEVSKRTEDPAP